MSELGELVVRIRGDSGQLEQALSRTRVVVQQSAGSMASAFDGLKSQILALAPALSAVAFIPFAKGALDAADQLDDFRKRTGFAVESLSALKTPLLIADSTLEEFSASIARMNNLVGEASKGISTEAVQAFSDLGLSVDSLARLSPEQQFYEIARALGGIGSQAEFTNKGMAIFGRSFVNIAPLIKDAGGEVEGFVEKAKQLGDVITQEEVDRIGDLNDRWTLFIEDTRKGLLGIIPIIERLANIPAYLRAALVELPYQAGQAIGTQLRGAPSSVSDVRPASVNYAVFRGNEAYGPAYRAPSARGSNADLLARIQAQKDAAKATSEHAKAIMSEEDALKLCTTAYDELGDKVKEVDVMQSLLHDRLAQGLTDVAFRARTAQDAMLGFANAIAEAYFQQRVANPLADALIGTGGKKGLLDNAIGSIGGLFGGFFAEGGKPPAGIPYVVGENGPELRVDGPGMIIPNHKIGGTTVIVQQTIQVNPGVPELITAKINEAAPAISAHAQSGVIAAMQQGGPVSRLIGSRN